MRRRVIIITGSTIFGLVTILIGFYHVALNSLSGGSGVSPKLVLVVKSNEYEVNKLLAIIDRIDGELGPRKNKKEAAEVDRFFYYKHAYWYPSNGSDIYGIALVEWDTTTWKDDDQKMGGSYFIDVYSEGKECPLCEKLKMSFLQNQVKFKSPCETQANLTEYERIRCKI